MVSNGSVVAATIWESQRFSRQDGEYLVRVVSRGKPLSAPEPEVAASGGLAGPVAIGVSALLRTLGRVVGRKKFNVSLVHLIPVDSRSYEERVVSVSDVRGEQEALERARHLADTEM